jgi:hypothetical protein
LTALFTSPRPEARRLLDSILTPERVHNDFRAHALGPRTQALNSSGHGDGRRREQLK